MVHRLLGLCVIELTYVALRKTARSHHANRRTGSQHFNRLQKAKDILLYEVQREEFKATLELPDIVKKLTEDCMTIVK